MGLDEFKERDVAGAAVLGEMEEYVELCEEVTVVVCVAITEVILLA